MMQDSKNQQKPGILMRIAEASPGPIHSADLPSPRLIPFVKALYRTSANDGKTPSQNTLYFLSDIESFLNNSDAYDTDLRTNADTLTSLSWVVLSFINGRDRIKSGDSKPHNDTVLTFKPLISHQPPKSSVIVLNGSTPRDDKEDDYHAWYDTEHGAKLANVPGWQAMRRYKFEKVYGEAEVAKFYGMNVYDQDNGLGGREWQDGVTEWTLRIREQAMRPNIRRVWKLEEATLS